MKLAFKYAWKWKSYCHHKRYLRGQDSIKEQVSKRIIRQNTIDFNFKSESSTLGSSSKYDIVRVDKRPEPRRPEYLLDEGSMEFKKSHFPEFESLPIREESSFINTKRIIIKNENEELNSNSKKQVKNQVDVENNPRRMSHHQNLKTY